MVDRIYYLMIVMVYLLITGRPTGSSLIMWKLTLGVLAVTAIWNAFRKNKPKSHTGE